ncbi:hypothetical protein PUNSTDRAFT_134301 [Punctularia strigosozonata HHB-11173 SS5]|uniref:uncharacterized protein n=1 Tax=Punctularia strigosozonata (strain HHB-11173) TaxID=741275 RepID=UPI0004416ED0|nr:uncharacterized protein PUNSTDRAFT_134301 [Punctularia strigosozonata HHB-11173 SS5]EIN09135.1 hypothetical protein PUNSTDRAFT_134301 [Punctularia strigosozonata HHB-11173 SS5]
MAQEFRFKKFPGLLGYIQHQIKCEVCFHTPFHTSKAGDFSACSRCELAWWCSPSCAVEFDRAHNADLCRDLQTVACVERLKIDYAIARHHMNKLAIRTPQPRTQYIQLSSLRGWDDYNTCIFPKFDFAAEFTSREFGTNNKDVARATKLLAMESTVLPLTVLAALEQAIPSLEMRSKLCIHFVSVESREFHGRAMTEEILHYLPSLRALNICLVGPNIPTNSESETEWAESELACPPCASRGRTREAAFYKGPYEVFVHKSNHARQQPDLIVALNTGFSEVETVSWRKTLEVIIDGGVPAVFTAYSHAEAEMEESILRDMGVRFIQKVEKNKWRGPVPRVNSYLQWAGDDVSFYNSHYWYIIQGRK